MTIQRQDHIAQDQVDGLSSSLESIPTVTVATSAPASPAVGDIWMNSSNGYQMQEWDGATWNTIQFGTDAIAAGSVTTDLLAAGAVTAANVQAGTVVAGIVDGTTIEGAQVVVHGTSGEVLVYNGTPALGNLILAISASSGVDSYGNAFNAGLSISTGESGGEFFTFYDSGIQHPIGAVVGGSYASPNPGVYFEDQHGNVLIGAMNNPNPALNTPYLQLWDAINNFALKLGTLAAGNGLQIGSGPTGKYYYEEVTLSGSQSIPSGTVTQVKPYTAGTLYSDYGSAWNLTTGVWTCPVSGPYDWDVVMGLIGSLSNARCFVRVCKTFNTGPFYCVDDVPISAGNLLSATGTFSANAGDQYHVEVYQSTGASHTLDNTVSYVHIGRRL